MKRRKNISHLFIMIAFLGLPSIMQAQNQMVRLQGKNITLKMAFDQIEKQTGLSVGYAVDPISNAKTIDADRQLKMIPKPGTLSVVMSQLLSDTDCKFTINATHIIITTPSKPTTPVGTGKKKTITGSVTDSKGEPIIGATIFVKGAKIGTTTNLKGGFTLPNIPGGSKLVVSYIGYQTKELAVDSGAVSIALSDNAQSLSEVTVVAYGVQKKESVVSAISTVNFTGVKVAAPRSLNNALVGKVSGVISVQRSGEPGYDDAQFWIRGISTFGAGASPLVLVDGVERPISNIDPEEIETFSVLKDAAATSVYGIKGANGVILVTTRRGSNQKPSVNFKMETGISSPTSLTKLVDGPTWLNLYNEAQLATNPSFITPYTPEIIEKYKSGADPYLYPNVDWIDMMMKDNTSNRRASLNISGGGETSKYFVSAGYYTEDGIWKGDNLNAYNTNASLKRYNFRANIDVDLNKETQLSLGIGGILVTANYPGIGSGDLWGSIQKNTPIGYSPTYPDPNNSTKFVYGGINSLMNPFAQLTGTGFKTQWRNNIQSDITLRHDLSRLIKGLTIQGKFAFDGYNYHNINQTRNYLVNNDQVDKYTATGRDADGNLILSRLVTGQAGLTFSKASAGNRRIYSQANIDYSRTFGKHTVKGLLLYNQQDYQDADATTDIASLPFRLQGVVSRLSYNYDNRYFTEFSTGYNGSENFKKGHRFGFFPAIAAGWIVSEEPFFKNNMKFFDFLKVRGSWGIKGNDQIGGRRFAYITTVGGGNGGYTFGMDANNAFAGRGEDQWGTDLSWERETEIDFGLEMRFQGFTFQGDVFKRHRTGIFLQRASLPTILGLQNNPYGNLGEFENKGYEVSLEYRKRIGQLDVAFRGNCTFARNMLIDNDQPDYKFAYQNREGKRLNQPFGLIATGLFVDQNDINNSPAQQFGSVRPGDIKYLDYNDDGVVNSYDQVAIGDPVIPELIYGFGTTLGFKGFDFSLFFQGNGNASFMLGGDGWFPFQAGGLIGGVNQNALSRWTPENPSQDVLFPRLSFGANTNNYQSSTWWQRDGSYIRLKTAEIGYTIPKAVTQKLKINTVRFYVSGLNLITWSSFKFWDPELGSQNGGAYPIQKTFNCGVNVNF